MHSIIYAAWFSELWGHTKHNTDDSGCKNYYNNENITNKASSGAFFSLPHLPIHAPSCSPSLPARSVSSHQSLLWPATADAVIIIAVVGRSLHRGCTVIWTNCDEMSSLLEGWKTLVGTHGAGSGIKNVDKIGKGNILFVSERWRKWCLFKLCFLWFLRRCKPCKYGERNVVND